VTDDIFTMLPPEPYVSAEYGVKGAPATRLLLDGDIIDLGDRHFEVIHTPGHSPGGIALWEKETGILFSGDIVYDGPLIEDCYHSDADAYIASMKRLLEIPVRIVHGGHFASFDGERLREVIEEWLSSHPR
jgi:glyoxylase-like metal-dependent hydrolase (beta-lactamase superfamily II)